MKLTCAVFIAAISFIVGVVFFPLPHRHHFTPKTRYDHTNYTVYDFTGHSFISPKSTLIPENTQAVQKIVTNANQNGEKIRVYNGHAMKDFALSTDIIVSLEKMNKVIKVLSNTVEVEAGIKVKDLADHLEQYKLGLPVAGSSLDTTISDAITTGEYVSGSQSLSSSVIGVEIVTGRGDIKIIDQDNNPELLPAVRLSLGSLGIITKVTLKVSPLTYMRHRGVNVRKELFKRGYNSLFKKGEHDSFWVFPGTDIARYIRVYPVPTYSMENLKPDFSHIADEYFVKILSTFLWFFSDMPQYWNFINTNYLAPSFRYPDYIDRSDLALVTYELPRYQEIEYFISDDIATEAINKFLSHIDGNPSLVSNLPINIRVIENDDTWLSPQYQRRTIAIGVKVYENPYKFNLISEEFEKIMTAYKGRPHWGKLHNLKYQELKALYPKLEEFKKLRDELDPSGLFLNPHIKSLLY